MKTVVYYAGRLLVKLLFGCVARIHVIGRDKASCAGGFLLSSNHISHFDPFLISLTIRRKIDWMTMAEFFRPPALSFFLRSIDAFPAERDRGDVKTIRTAINRLKSGRVVGLFPEGGIRDGARSLLEGAPLRPGAAKFAQIADVPVIPCVILGTDRLYSKQEWLPLRRTPVWIAFGKPLSASRELQRSQARKRIESELAGAFKNLYAELREKFRLTADDLPQSSQRRMSKTACHAERRRGGPLQDSIATSRNSSSALRSGRNNILQRASAKTVDSLLCASINWLHRRHPLNGHSRQDMERYLTECERLSPREYYVAPKAIDADEDSDSKPTLNGVRGSGRATVSWRSPIETAFAANNTARMDFFPTDTHTWSGAPTIFLLHSLMSSSPTGYYRWADKFKHLGWNACFVHLPYHFSRVPAGYWNGELAITPNLVRNAEGLRQSVIELRQIMKSLRERGCHEFGVLATSYGGWIGALLTLVESDFRFVALMSPITNLEHAIWYNPATRRVRRELDQAKVDRALVARHFHLSSPLHSRPMCDPTRILFVTGDLDSIAPSAEIEAIHQSWRGSELLRVRQGHFGHRMMPETIAYLKQRGDI
jgi:1-acyl-sn-glycerol-3-phosphate acyltransferase